MADYKIVCIDDEVELLDGYLHVFQNLGYDVEAFSDPFKALDYIINNQKNIVLVVSDLKMPEMDGMELREKLLEAKCETPFVIVTGFYDIELAKKAMSLKIIKFIQKPLQVEDNPEVFESEIQKRIEVLEEEAGMAAAFLEETTPMLEEIEELILTLEEDPSNQQALNTYFRLLHTIKGTSACLGLDVISKFSHAYEDFITSIKDGKHPLENSSIDVLLKGLDYLKQMYQYTSEAMIIPFSLEESISIFDQAKLQEAAKSPTSKAMDEEAGGSVDGMVHKEKKEKDEKLNVSIRMLEEFMEQSGELTVLKNTIFKNLSKLNIKLPGDRELGIVSEAMEEMHKVSSYLQNQISEIKKVSIDSIFRPMKRVVRDSARNCEKAVEFHTVGEELRIDTSLGKVFSNILVHMLRNSVDHGIETEQERKELGKTPKGNIWLSVKESGEDIVIEIKDDGKGINPDVIRKLALEKGLYYAQELESMPDNRVFHIIFEPGFSTASVVTEISGRGVGMDMVKSSIKECGGSIHIESAMGEGTTFSIIIPIPRSIQIINSLMVDVGEHLFSVPLDNVAEVVLFEKGKKNDQYIDHINGKMVLRHQGQLIPLIETRRIFNLEPMKNQDSMNIVVIRDKVTSYGIVVDKINDIEEIIVKKLHDLMEDCEEYLGTTFVGDGNISLILDVNGIARKYSIELAQETELNASKIEKEQAHDFIEYMKFRLVNGQLFALPLSSVYRFEVIDCKKINFTGNLPVVKYRNSSLIIVFLEHSLQFDDFELEQKVSEMEKLDVIVVERNERWYGLVVNELLDIGKSDTPVDAGSSDRPEILGVTFIEDQIVSILNLEMMLGQKAIKRITGVNEGSSDGQLSINMNDYSKAG
jgi:two-component system chemotaxis sensor kinase CheA